MINAYDKAIRSLCFSPDGKIIATAGDRAIRLWDVQTGKKLGEATIGDDLASWALFGNGGKTLICAAGTDDRIHLLHRESLKTWASIPVGEQSIRGISVSSDHKLIALGLEGRVMLIDARTGKETLGIRLGTNESATTLAFAAEGKTLAVLADKDPIRLFRVNDGKEIRRLTAPSEEGLRTTKLVFSPTAPVLAAGTWFHSLICLWDTDQGKLIREIRWGPQLPTNRSPTDDELQAYRRHKPGVEALSCSPDGKTLAAACCDGQVRLWEVATGGLRYQANLPAALLAFSPRGSVLATNGFRPGMICLYDWHDPGVKRGTRLTTKVLDRLWDDCAGEDAAAAYRSVATLIASPKQAVDLLKRRLKRREPIDSKSLAGLVGNLDAEDAMIRKRAFEQLVALDKLAEKALQAAIAGKPSAEVGKRATELLKRLQRIGPEQRRLARAVEILEVLGTKEAIDVLMHLSGGADRAIETREARQALKRLGHPKRASR